MQARSSEPPDIHALVRQIADHLPGWVVEPCDSHWVACLACGYGPQLTLHYDRGRVRISGTWPADTYGHHYCPDDRSVGISCALDRGPRAIAQDIERRFLPEYLPLWAHQDRARQKAEEANRQAESLVRRLEKLFGLAPIDYNRNGYTDAMEIYLGRARFIVYRFGSSKVEISTKDPDSVLRIAEFVKTLSA